MLQVLTYHYYCWFADSGDGSKPYSNLKKSDCDGSSNKLGLGPRVFKAIDNDRRDLQAPVFMSEWGGKSPQASQAHSKSFAEISEVSSPREPTAAIRISCDLLAIMNSR